MKLENKIFIESPTPPQSLPAYNNKDYFWVDYDENTGLYKNIKKFENGEWKDVISTNGGGENPEYNPYYPFPKKEFKYSSGSLDLTVMLLNPEDGSAYVSDSNDITINEIRNPFQYKGETWNPLGSYVTAADYIFTESSGSWEPFKHNIWFFTGNGEGRYNLQQPCLLYSTRVISIAGAKIRFFKEYPRITHGGLSPIELFYKAFGYLDIYIGEIIDKRLEEVFEKHPGLKKGLESLPRKIEDLTKEECEDIVLDLAGWTPDYGSREESLNAIKDRLFEVLERQRQELGLEDEK